MADNHDQTRDSSDSELEREICQGRKFTLEEAIARLVGPGGMKGVSPVAKLQQAAVEIETWLRLHLSDAGGALGAVLHRAVRESELLLSNPDQPLTVLASCCQTLLHSDFLLTELVRTADIEWGRMMNERPMFEIDGSASRPDDPYTLESVRNSLRDLLRQLADDTGHVETSHN
jgi:hypothetical protein